MKRLYIVQVTGARDWDDPKAIAREFNRIGRKVARAAESYEVLIIHGGAPGADSMCDVEARARSWHTARVDALWATRHRGAGPQRNGIMVAMGPADENLAFHHDLPSSRGTKDMVKQLRDAGRKVKVIS